MCSTRGGVTPESDPVARGDALGGEGARGAGGDWRGGAGMVSVSMGMGGDELSSESGGKQSEGWINDVGL